jgi:hypothetical protein
LYCHLFLSLPTATLLLYAAGGGPHVPARAGHHDPSRNCAGEETNDCGAGVWVCLFVCFIHDSFTSFRKQIHVNRQTTLRNNWGWLADVRLRACQIKSNESMAQVPSNKYPIVKRINAKLRVLGGYLLKKDSSAVVQVRGTAAETRQIGHPVLRAINGTQTGVCPIVLSQTCNKALFYILPLTN